MLCPKTDVASANREFRGPAQEVNRAADSGRAAAARDKISTEKLRVDVWTFLLELIRIVAWPVTTLGLAILLRREIRALLENVRSLRWGSMQIDFEEKLQEAREAEVKLMPPVSSSKAPEASPFDEIRNLAIVNPHLAIRRAFYEIKERVKEKAGAAGLPARTFPKSLEGLVDAGIMPVEVAEFVNDLREIRNLSLKAEPSTADALNFIQLAERTARTIRTAG